MECSFGCGYAWGYELRCSPCSAAVRDAPQSLPGMRCAAARYLTLPLRPLAQGPLKAAVYRDEQGQLHTHAATCTHLGCVVAWNPLEKTFDWCEPPSHWPAAPYAPED